MKKKCDCCNKKRDMADVFIFREKTYCMDCLYSLIMDMAESGNLYLELDDTEEKGIRVHF